MKDFIFASCLFIALILVIPGCNHGAVSRQTTKLSGDLLEGGSKADLVVKVVGPVISHDRLEFKWEINNPTTKTVYIYSSLLENPAAVQVNLKPETHTLQVLFLSLQTIPAVPYSFPESNFIEIPPGQLVQGHFANARSVSEVVGSTLVGKKHANGVAAPSQWQVEILVAYGEEIESVQKDIKELHTKGTQHPINPIVRWQKIAYSKPVMVTIRK
jgi:hypothetical protein